MTDPPNLDALLDAAVAAIGGQRREGQHVMATAVADALETGEHLLVQAGTGTGKSLAYLVPLLAHQDSVVVATATIALQRQLVDRDLPNLVDSLEPLLGRRPSFSMLKGRSNYVCLHRLNVTDDVPDEQEALFDPAPTSKAGKDVVRIRQWAEATEIGDRDELVPAPDERAWRSLSVTPHECLGAQRCAFSDDCFAEAARERARSADVVVTNHAMLAIDALSEARLLPEVDVIVVDEAHELADRATNAVTDELTAGMVERAARRCRRFAGDTSADLMLDAAGALASALESIPAGRIEALSGALFDAAVAVRDAGHDALSAMSSSPSGASAGDEQDGAARVRAKAAVDEAYEVAGRIVVAGEKDVLWVTESDRRPPAIWRAPLFVGGPLRQGLFDERTVILTSATLELGGGFEPIARGLGLTGEGAPSWRGLDVGSPFDYERQAILYVAAHLPAPGRDGLSAEAFNEIQELIDAAGGRTLGLFSSMRAAKSAAEEMRERLDLPILCQGDDATGELVRQFAADARTCLFGTLSLWQGVDVPGSALQLVLIDRLPFPRPDDPLASARQRYVESHGGNGFMSVAATQASLRIAQGAGRLIRDATDRGVVAVLDSRLEKARYGGFVRASLPPMWPTTDSALVRASLRKIDQTAPEPLPVAASPWSTAESTAVSTAAAGAGSRHGKRWMAEEEESLRGRFVAGTPLLVLAEELGRTRGAVVSRMRSMKLLGTVAIMDTNALGEADESLGYLLAQLPPSAFSDLSLAAEALAVEGAADGWEVEQDGDVLRAVRAPVSALVATEDAESLVFGDATSRWLLSKPGESIGNVTGITGVVTHARFAPPEEVRLHAP